MPFIMSKPRGGVPPAQRWRIMPLGNEWDAMWLAEIEMAATAGGTDLCTGGTPFHSGGPGTLANLFDNNTGTSYQTGQYEVTTYSFGYEFATPVSIAEVRLTAESTRGPAAPTSFAVQSSTDGGSTWKTYALHTGLTAFTNGQQRSFSVGTTAFPTGIGRTNARGWRIVPSATVSFSWSQLGEIIMATTAGGATVCTGGGYIANGSTYAFGRLPANAFDGNTSTQWQIARTPGCIGYAFNSAKNIVEMRLTIGTADTGGAPADFTIEYTEDFTTWTTISTVTGQSGWSSGTYKTFSF